MAITEERFNSDGVTRIFTPSSTILSQNHVRVDERDNTTEEYTYISPDKWDLINNSIVFRDPPENGKTIVISISTTGEDLNTPLSAIDIVANIADEVSIVAEINNEVKNVSLISDEVKNVSLISDEIVKVSDNVEQVKTVADNIIEVNSYYKTYLGAYDNDNIPTTRRDGSDLLEGDLYFNTDENYMKVWSDSAWKNLAGITKPELDTYTGDNIEYISDDTDGVKGKRYMCDTTGGSFTITLPDSPELKDKIYVWDDKDNFSSDSVTLARNGNTINGKDEDLELDLSSRLYIVECVSDGDTANWRVF